MLTHGALMLTSTTVDVNNALVNVELRLINVYSYLMYVLILTNETLL